MPRALLLLSVLIQRVNVAKHVLLRTHPTVFLRERGDVDAPLEMLEKPRSDLDFELRRCLCFAGRRKTSTVLRKSCPGYRIPWCFTESREAPFIGGRFGRNQWSCGVYFRSSGLR
jgi:hypothetical protein